MTIHNWLEKTKDVTLENTDKKAMLTMIKEARALMGVTEGVRPTKSAILNAICGHYSVGVIAVRDGHGKTTTLSEPRALCYYLMRELTDSSLIAIGEFMGGRDHTCVIHGVKKIKKQLETDERIRRSVLLITQSLGVQAGSKPPFDFRGDNVNGPNF